MGIQGIQIRTIGTWKPLKKGKPFQMVSLGTTGNHLIISCIGLEFEVPVDDFYEFYDPPSNEPIN